MIRRSQNLWRGDLCPLGCEAALKAVTRCVGLRVFSHLGLLRSPAGINPLATERV